MSFNCVFCSSGRIPAEPEPCEKAQATDHFNHIGTKLSIWRSHFVMLLPPQMLVFKMSKLRLDYKGREGSEINNSFGKEKHKSHLSLRLGPFAMLLLLWEIFFTPSLLRRLSAGRGKCFPSCQKVKNKYQNNLPCWDEFFGNPMMVRKRLERRRRRFRGEIIFLIENLLSWKHIYIYLSISMSIYISRMQHATLANAYLVTNKWNPLLATRNFQI